MEAVEGIIDLEKLKTGKYILLSVECMDDGTVIDNPNIHVGDTIRLNHIREDGLFGSIGESYEFTIMAKVRKNENTTTTRNTGASRLYLPHGNLSAPLQPAAPGQLPIQCENGNGGRDGRVFEQLY